MTNATDSTIRDVSDTALWVAVYRAQESERPDALFQDPFAARLAGDRGHKIAKSMAWSKYTAWTLTIRTVIIDSLIRDLLKQGLDTVINLGAGLDTRPYRLDLPNRLRWVEADFPHMIQHKEKLLGDQKPHCHLERVSVDLTDRRARKQLLARATSDSKKTLVLTEGVIPYLRNQDVAELAQDLREQQSIGFWIAEYISPKAIQFIRRQRRKELKNAPFLFDPGDWFGFFGDRGWQAEQTRYMAEESLRLGRPVPTPWWMGVVRLLIPSARQEYRKLSAYVLLTPK